MSVEVDDQGPVRTIRMSRPHVRNALDTAMAAEMLEAVGAALSSESVRVLVFAGAHGTFSSGVDLGEALDAAGHTRRMDLLGQLFEAVATAPKPTVAAVSGHCVGAGVEIAAGCDLRVASPTASFRFPGAALGYPMGTAKLIGLVGLGAAKDLVLTARTFGAEEAQRLGFVQRLTPSPDEVANALAQQIAVNHRDTVAYMKRLFARFSNLGDRVAAENDVLLALTEAGGDYGAITADKPGVGGWAGGHWVGR